MNMKRALLATTVSLALGAGAQVANAGVYGVSYLVIDDLTIFISEDGTNPGGATVTNFNFNSTNTAFLNTGGGDVGGATSATCSGTIAANDCDSNPATPVLDAPVYNAPGSTVLQANNVFAPTGPGTEQYSHADSVIDTAQLVTGLPTSSTQLAQSEIQSAQSANSNSTLSSGTSITMTFEVAESGILILNFDAGSYLQSQTNLLSGAGLSQADVSVTFQLSNANGSQFVRWAPDGTATDNCIAVGITACTELADGWDLNDSANASNQNENETISSNGLNPFGLSVAGLSAGEFTLTLSAITKTNLSRIPVPGTILLLGMGLLGMAGSLKRKSVRS